MLPELIATQRCGKCKEFRQSTEFAPSQRGRHGFTCRKCRRNAYPRKQHEPRECDHCGERYIPKQVKGATGYCDADCKDAAYKARMKAELLASKAGRICAAAECDIDISSKRSDAKWCSDACAQRQRTPELRRKYRLSNKYGISPGDYDAMLKRQNGTCAICERNEPNTTHGFWHIDHCHETGRVRGLLCSTCNTGLGSFFDNADWLKRAAEYVA